MRAIPSAFTSLVPSAQDAFHTLGGWAAPIVPTRPVSRWLLSLTLLGGIGLCAAWLAVRHVPAFGPWLADGLRSLVGSERVTQLEETVAGVEDRVQQAVSDGRARSLSDATPSELLVSVAESKLSDPAGAPRALGALYPTTASPEVAIAPLSRPEPPPLKSDAATFRC
jgi:hypothetical protein